ncbi:MAG: hypothetical protein M3O30_12445 [Planctomycetota bacterium]|nr:hypothetical protein [Planctomycetota bacterium]
MTSFSRYLSLIAIGLIFAAGLPQLCCATVSRAGNSTTAKAVCPGGQADGCACCEKNKGCGSWNLQGAQGGDSKSHLPASGLCQQSSVLAYSQSAGNFLSPFALFVNFERAVAFVPAPRPSETSRYLNDPANVVGNPTLLSLNCALIV